MASVVNVCSVNVLGNPGKFDDPFKLEITFECYEPLADDLDWELVYVGSGESNAYDQILDSILVGPVVEGRHKFIFEAGGPDPSKIPESEIVGVTVLLLKCKYMEQEFINIGWFFSSPLQLQRRVCIDDVRVTTFAIKWHKNEGSGDTEGVETVDLRSVEITSEKTEDDSAIKSDVDKSDDGKQDAGIVEEKIEADVEVEASLDGASKTTTSVLPLLDVTNESIPDLVD
ncbi:unnamed protein product [Brugia timori]|uniref:Anti-silencing function protein 1 n=1 Tax=Brugia timori TaxID=42155 RepID=A0A0R3QQR8_9BILA|nr:unnamed protein product [Brugia timori]